MLRSLLQDEQGQTTMEWMVLAIMIAMTMIIIGLATGKGLMAIWEALTEKIGGFVSAIGI